MRASPKSAGAFWLLTVAALFSGTSHSRGEGTALVRHAPQINAARVEGSLQQMLGENVSLNGNAVITMDLLVPGSSTVVLNGHPAFGGTAPGSGPATPSGYQITLNGKARLGLLRTRTAPVALPTVSPPPASHGTRSVTINSAGQSAGDWDTLCDLTLNGNAGQYSVPPGTYRNFTAHGGSGFTLGVAGATAPAVYSFESLTLNGRSSLQVAGPVVLTTSGGVTMDGQCGNSAHPEWLEIRLATGGLTLNGGSLLYAMVLAPAGSVILSGNSSLTGGLISDRLTLSGNALLRLRDTVVSNRPPVAQAQSLTTAEDTALPVTLTAQDPDSSSLLYTVLTPPQHGTLSGAAPSLTYTPHPNYSGPDNFTFNASDGALTSAAAAISLTVTPVNDPPAALDQTIALTEDTPAAVALGASDIEGSALTYTILVPPQHGTLSGAAPDLNYLPAPNYCGPDSFAWLVNDGAADSVPAIVTLDVQPVSDTPFASPLNATVDEDATVDIILTGTDGDGDALTFATVSAPLHGTIYLLGNVVTYVPDGNYFGPDAFAYTVSDGSLHVSEPADVNVTVYAVNDVPFVASGAAALDEDAAAVITFDAGDSDGDTLAWSVITEPQHGTLSGSGPEFTFIPSANYHGSDSLTVRVTDPSGASSDGGAALAIAPVNDAPAAETLTVSTAEEASAAVDLTALDVDGDPLTFTVITPPEYGTLSGEAPHFIYTPGPDFSGEDTLAFSVTDGAETDGASVFIAVTPVNDAPLANAGTLTTPEDIAAVIDLSALASDVDDAALSYVILTSPQYGTLSGGGPLFTFTPQADWHGTDSVTWRAADAAGLTASASLAITVTPVNDAPAVTALPVDPLKLPAFASLTATATDDGDPPGQANLDVLWSQVSGPGVAVFATPGHLNTAAAFTEAGNYMLRVTVSDEELSEADEVAVLVLPANQPPALSIAPIAPVLRGAPLALSGSAADDGLPAGSGLVTFWSATGPGTAGFSAVASLETTVTFDTAGTWQVRLRGTDGELLTEAAVAVTVLEPNHAPLVTTRPPLVYELGQPPVILTGSVSDDGEPRGAAVTSLWTQTSGPAPAVIVDPAALVSAVSFTEPGDYVFTLTASDTLLTGSAALTVQVIPPQNRAPAVNAGGDQSLDGQFFTVLTGSAQDDGLRAGLSLTTSWTQLSGPSPAALGAASELSTGVTASQPGAYVFRLTVSDGSLTASDEVSVTLTFSNEPPSVNAGADQLTEDSHATLHALVTDDGRPAPGELTLTWEMVDGPGTALFASAARATTRVDVSADGAYTFRLTAFDGEATAADSVSVTFGDLNQTPQVNAGADQTETISFQRSANLILNSGAESSAVGTAPASWTIATGAWRTAAASSGAGYPGAVEGARYFHAGAGTADAELLQNVDVTAWAANIDAGSQAFQFVLRFRSLAETMLDRGRVILEFRDASAVLHAEEISLSPASNQWSVATAVTAAPAGTRTVRVRLRATNNLSNGSCDAYFDALELRALTSSPLVLSGTASDDGLPPGSSVSTQWRQISGPTLTSLIDPAALATSVFFTAPGAYQFELSATDGAKTGADTLQVTLAPGAGNGPPAVNAGPDQEIILPVTQVQIAGNVTDGTLTGTLVYSWSQVSGPEGVVIDNPSSLTPNVSLPESGTFVLRLYATDGEFTAADDVTLTAACPPLHQPLDVVLVIDSSTSMDGARLANAKLAAADFVLRTDSLFDRASFVRFTGTASLVTPLTNDSVKLVADINATGANGTTAINTGLAAARTHLQAAGRPEADQVIILLTDGESSAAPAIAEANAAKAAGIRILTIALESTPGAALLQTLASVIGDYHFVRDATTLTELYGSVARSFCLTGEPYAEAFAGPDITGSVNTQIALSGRTVFPRPDPRTTTVRAWSKLGGPGNVIFGDAAEPVTTVSCDAPGIYLLVLEARVTSLDGNVFVTRDQLRARIDQPSRTSLSAGLTAWWDFDESLRDAAGNHHLILRPAYTPPQFEPSPGGAAWRFPGNASSGLSAPVAPDINLGTVPALTIEFWVHRSVPGTGTVLRMGVNVQIYAQSAADNLLYCSLGNYTAGLPVPNVAVSIGAWHHVVVTYDASSNLQINYLDGAPVGIVSPTARGAVAANSQLVLGGTLSGTSNWNGSLDDLAIYERALTPEEVAASWAAGAGSRCVQVANAPPSVHAGDDRRLAQPGSLLLAGTAQDDGLPSGSPLHTAWTMLSGPAPVTFSDASSAATTATFAAPGTYRLQLSANDGEWAQIDSTVITVASPGGGALAADAALWWSFDDGYTERLQSVPGIARLTSLVPGLTNQALRLDSNNSSVSVPGTAASLSSEEFSLEGWFRPAGNGHLCHWMNGAQTGVFLNIISRAATSSSPSRADYRFNIGSAAINFSAIELNRWQHITVSYSRSSGLMRAWVDGVPAVSSNVGAIDYSTSNFTLGPLSGAAPVGTLMDEIIVYERALTDSEVLASYHAGGAGKSPPSANSAPFVYAGADFNTPAQGTPVALQGVVSDDGLPADSGLVAEWSQYSGPGMAVFGNVSAAATSVTFPQHGVYWLKLRAHDGMAAAEDIVAVHVGTGCSLPPPAGMVSWWPFDGDGADAAGASPLTLSPYLTKFDPGYTGAALRITGNDGAAVPSLSPLITLAPASLTVEGWVRRDDNNLNGVIVDWRGPNSANVNLVSFGNFSLECGIRTTTAGFLRAAVSPNPLTPGVWHHVAFTLDNGATKQSRLYVNGVVSASSTFTAAIREPMNAFSVGWSPAGGFFQGLLDDFAIYNRPLSDAEIAAIHAAGACGKEIPPVNTAPRVTAGPDLSAEMPGAAVLSGTAADDALPAGSVLTTLWEQTAGPSAAVIADAPLLETAVTFSDPGSYTFRLTATDGTLSAADSLTVIVLPPQNRAPLANAGADASLPQNQTLTLAGAATDDGLPAGTVLTYAWAQVSGPGTALFSNPNTATPQVQFTAEGNYVLRLTVSDSLLSGSDEARFNVTAAVNSAPLVDAGPDRSVAAGAALTITPQLTDDGLVRPWLSIGWRLLNGAQYAALQSAPGGGVTVTFNRTGTYTLEITANDGEFSAGDSVVVTITSANTAPPAVTLTSPADGSVFEAGDAILLTAAATDPESGGGIDTIQFFSGTQPLSGPLVADAAGVASFAWAGAAEGAHALTALATDFSGTTAQSAAVNITVAPSRPRLTWQNPVQHDVFQSADTVTLLVDARPGAAGAAITSVEFLARSPGAAAPVSLGVVSAAPWEFAWPAPAVEGAWELTALATDASDATVAAALIVHLSADLTAPPVLDILSPADAATITSPVNVTGTVSGPTLQSYSLQFRPVLPDNAGIWRTLATGAAAVTGGFLGTLDPTLLENGPYELRLTASTWDGSTLTAEPVAVLLDGNMKIGHFALAFEDLSVPMPGLNITVTRSYDSRRTDSDDFGVGWDLAVSSIRLVKNRPLASGWSVGTTENPVILPGGTALNLWCARAPLRKLVTLTLPDGTALTFQPRLEVHPSVRIYSPEPDCSVVPQNQVKVVFLPAGKTLGTLEPIDPPDALAFSQLNDGPYGLGAAQPGVCRLEGGILSKGLPGFDPSYEPVKFKYTSPEGAVFIVEESKGVESLTDRNGNSLTFTPNAITYTGSAGVPPAPGAVPAPITQTITFTRDPAGRITAITDPAGQQLLYAYDSIGRLSTFTDRAAAVMEYRYTNPANPFYLTEIIDPFGHRAVKSLFDAGGRLIGQEDADGHAVVMTHDIANRREEITDRLGHTTVHEYDLNGNIVKTTDALGGITIRTYDARDRELTLTDPLGHTTSKTYDSSDNILSETDALGHTTTYTYNTTKQPLTITDPLGHVTSFSYDSNGNTTAIVDAMGRATTFSFNGNGSVTSLTMPGGTAYNFTLDAITGQKLSQIVTGTDGTISAYQTFTYDAHGEESSTTEYLVPAGATDTTAATPLRRTEHTFDAAGRMTAMQMKDALGNVLVQQSWTYNANGDELTYTDPLGRVTTNEYDSMGRDSRTLHPDGTTSVMVYDANDGIISTINRSGGVMNYEMDELGRQTKVTNVDGSLTRKAYDAAGREISSTDELGRTSTKTYDAANRLATSTDPEGNTIAFTYDAAGNRTSETDAGGRTALSTLDALGRVVVITAPDGSTSSVTYDASGRVSVETDAMGHTTHRGYDAQGRLIKVTDAIGGITRMEHDSIGRPLLLIDALGRITSYTSDAMGRRTSRTLPGGQTEHITWTNSLQVASRTDFNGYTTSFHYDADGLLIEKRADLAHPSLTTPHAAAKVRYTYNQFDLPATAESLNAAGAIIHAQSWSYDAHGRMTGTTTPVGTLTYTRDAQDKLTGISGSNPDGIALTYEYDPANRLTAVNDHRGPTVRTHAFDWTPSGALASVNSASGITHTFLRDAMDRVAGLAVNDASSNPLETFGYTYNPAGRRTGISESSGRQVGYQYDALHHMTQESISASGPPVPGGLPVTPGALDYTFDAVGNRLARNSTLASPAPGSQFFAFNANNELAGITYDKNGNPVTGTATLLPGPLGHGTTNPPVIVGTTYIYDFEDRLIRLTRSDGVVIDLTYDANGNRVAKTVVGPGAPAETTTYLVDAASPNGWPQCVEERKTVGSITTTTIFHYGPHGPVSQQITGSTTHEYLLDAHGSIRALVDPTGQITAATDYDAYGIPLATGGTAASALGYNGEYYDSDLGLIYLRSRFYDPSTGRFLNRDPYQGTFEEPHSLHAYHFAAGDPVNAIDPSGNFSLFELTATQLLAKFARYAQPLLKADKVSDKAITTIVPVIIAFNYVASQASVLQNVSLGKIGQWTWQEIALFQALPYQRMLLKQFEKKIELSKDPLEAFKRWRRIVDFMNKGLGGSVLGRSQGNLGVLNKMNGFPELTPYTSLFRGSIFVHLTETRARDVSAAGAMSPVGTSVGTWHHHEVIGVMQNVDSTMHRFFHHGGRSLYDALSGD